jgi:L-iditol 2-dehydrogenase
VKAVILQKPGEFGPSVVADPRPEAGDLLLRVKACSLCGTDIRVLEGKKTRGVRYPSIIGHEFAGIIEEVGRDAKGFHRGDRVSVAPVMACHACRYCMDARENACRNRVAIGYEYDGGFAEFVRIPARAVEYGHVVRIPDGTGFDEAALAEPLACCINGTRKADVGLGDAVLVVGAGPIGLMHLQLARAAGAGMVLVSEPNPRRREEAARFRADRVVDPAAESLREIVMDVTGGLGADAVIMAIGAPDIVNGLLKLLRKGGRLNLFAGFPDAGATTIEANLIHYNEITVNGTSAATRLDYLTAVSMIASHRVNVKDLVTHRFGLDGFGEAYNLHRTGVGLKLVIEP